MVERDVVDLAYLGDGRTFSGLTFATLESSDHAGGQCNPFTSFADASIVGEFVLE